MDELLEYFSEVTGVDQDRAKFHLDATGWDLQVALANFYECAEAAPTLDELATAAATAATVDAPVRVKEEKKSSDDESNSNRADLLCYSLMSRDSNVAGSGESTQPKDTKSSRSEPKARTNVRFGTIDRLQNRDSSSDEEGQAFYAGGSERSGQQVLGPSKKNDIINDMFKTCQGQSISSEDRPSSQHPHRPNTFGGTGYKLGQTSSESEVAGSTSQSGSVATASGPSPPTTLQTNSAGIITLKLWRDGFTINDREIRSYTEPENREFLAAIKRGEIPMEIREEVQGAEVRLDMEDHRHEEYIPPKAKVKAFTGRGHKLGSPSPATVGMTVPTDPADQAANESQARSSLNLDSSRPVTNIQIRLADGANIREQFNTSHTIGDLRRFITTICLRCRMRPQYALQEFSLLTTYPSRELNEESQTIEQAGLQNSAIMQRLK